MEEYVQKVRNFKSDTVVPRLKHILDRANEIADTRNHIRYENLDNAKMRNKDWVKRAYNPWKLTRWERLKIGADLLKEFKIEGKVDRSDINLPYIDTHDGMVHIAVAYRDKDGSKNIAKFIFGKHYTVLDNRRKTDFLFYA